MTKFPQKNLKDSISSSIWIILFRDEIITNLRNIFSNPVAFSIEAIVVPLVIILMIIQKTKGKPPAVV